MNHTVSTAETKLNTADWMPFYQELADKILPYRFRQEELIAFLEQLRAKGQTITRLVDKGESGAGFLLPVIDPFTFETDMQSA